MTVHGKMFVVAASFNTECLWLVVKHLRLVKKCEVFSLESFAVYGNVYLAYHIAENVGGRKHWRIWRIDGQSPKFSPSILQKL